MIDLDSQPKRGEHVLAQRAAETVILLKPDDGQYYTLDEVGARLWDLCDGTHRVSDLVSAIHAEYDAPLMTIQADVLELLGDLAREHLVAPAA